MQTSVMTIKNTVEKISKSKIENVTTTHTKKWGMEKEW